MAPAPGGRAKVISDYSSQPASTLHEEALNHTLACTAAAPKNKAAGGTRGPAPDAGQHFVVATRPNNSPAERGVMAETNGPAIVGEDRHEAGGRPVIPLSTVSTLRHSRGGRDTGRRNTNTLTSHAANRHETAVETCDSTLPGVKFRAFKISLKHLPEWQWQVLR